MNTELYSIARMQEIATRHGGICLSTEVQSISTRLTWRCKREHTFKMFPVSVNRGNWCGDCQQIDWVEKLHQLAKARNWICHFKGKKLEELKILVPWECNAGHKFRATLSAVEHDYPCLLCVIERIEQYCGWICHRRNELNGSRAQTIFSTCPNGHELLKGFSITEMLDGKARCVKCQAEHQGE